MIRVVVSIDTEADGEGGTWTRPDPLRFRSVTRGIPEVLTPMFATFGVRPTYLVSAEVLDDPAAVAVLAAARDAELGTHLHGDHVEPAARQRAQGTANLDFGCYYPEDVERAKIATITERFRDRFGRAPRAFRAGRYAASARTLRSLVEFRYAADASVAPRTRWTNEGDARQVLDFREAPLVPYRPSADDITRPGDLGIVEVPITVLDPPPWYSLAVSAGQRILGRAPSRYPIWLRPSSTPWPLLRWAAIRAIREATAGGDAWLQVMFHSVEVEPGASPYSRTPAHARRVVGRLHRLLGLLHGAGARSNTLSEIAALTR